MIGCRERLRHGERIDLRLRRVPGCTQTVAGQGVRRASDFVDGLRRFIVKRLSSLLFYFHFINGGYGNEAREDHADDTADQLTDKNRNHQIGLKIHIKGNPIS